MTAIRMVWVGRERKGDPESDLCERYIKRLKPYIKFESRVLKPVVTRDLNEGKRLESERILGALKTNDYLVLLDERGKQMRSPELATFINGRREAASGDLVFAIGGAMGVNEDLRARANNVLSLSKMTMPHALARAVLVEQIYRALSISAGHPYHHEG